MSLQSPRPTPVAIRRGIDPFWLGALALALLTVGLAIMITYGLGDLAWQQRFGAWNIWVGTACMVGTVIPLRLWTTSAHKA